MKILVWVILLILCLFYNLRFEGFESLLCWGAKEKKDYWGNDINSFSSLSLAECKTKCFNSSTCVGITRSVDENSNGSCWIKNKLDSGTADDSRWSYKYNRKTT